VSWTGQIGYDPAQVSGAYAGPDIKDGIYQPGANLRGDSARLVGFITSSAGAAFRCR
jgi:hypothetical protein